MTPNEKKERIAELWIKARRFTNKIRLEVKLEKMAEENLKELNINEDHSDDNNPGQEEKEHEKIEWYLVDTERIFCHLWNFMICLVTIYNMIVTPFIMTYPQIYQ